MTKTLPWPEGWRRRGLGRRVRLAALLLLVAVALAFAVADTVTGGPTWPALTAVALALVLAPSVRYHTAAGQRAEPRYAGPGVELPFSRVRLAAAAGETLAICLLGGALLGLRGDLRAMVGGLLCLAAGLMFAPDAVRDARRPPRLVLRPDGIRASEAGLETFVAWEHVAEVVAEDQVERGRSGLRSWYPRIVVAAREPEHLVLTPADSRAALRARRERATSIEVHTEDLGIDLVLAYWTLRYYATHPESRGELDSGAALDRIRRGDVVATPARASGW